MDFKKKSFTHFATCSFCQGLGSDLISHVTCHFEKITYFKYYFKLIPGFLKSLESLFSTLLIASISLIFHPAKRKIKTCFFNSVWHFDCEDYCASLGRNIVIKKRRCLTIQIYSCNSSFTMQIYVSIHCRVTNGM